VSENPRARWLASFINYLMHFYKTGEALPFRVFWRDDGPPIAALPIPEFRPSRWLSRYEGTVV
jgi:hypothetical protein